MQMRRRSITITFQMGYTPLHFAAQTENIASIELLAKHGADLDAVGPVSSSL